MPSITKGQKHMLAAVSFFALMNVIVKYLHDVPAHQIVLVRSIIILSLSYITLKKRKINPWGKDKPLLILRGVSGTIALLMFFYTLHSMPLASAVTIMYLSPIFTTLLASLVMKEHATFRQLIYFAIAFSGVFFVKGFDPRVSLFDLNIGILAAVFIAIAYNIVRKLKRTDHPIVVVFYFALVTTVLIGPYSFYNWKAPEPKEWGLLLTIGVLTHLAQLHLTRALQLERAVHVTQFTYVGTFYALAAGLILFNETMPPLALFGIGMIILGVMLGAKNSLKA
jgi:drug/metabolite transporter (DMT)-like permease